MLKSTKIAVTRFGVYSDGMRPLYPFPGDLLFLVSSLQESATPHPH